MGALDFVTTYTCAGWSRVFLLTPAGIPTIIRGHGLLCPGVLQGPAGTIWSGITMGSQLMGMQTHQQAHSKRPCECVSRRDPVCTAVHKSERASMLQGGRAREQRSEREHKKAREQRARERSATERASEGREAGAGVYVRMHACACSVRSIRPSASLPSKCIEPRDRNLYKNIWYTWLYFATRFLFLLLLSLFWAKLDCTNRRFNQRQ